MQRIAVIDYGMGNLHSAAKALSAVAPKDEIVVTDDSALISSADRIVFPGVGAIGDCMAAIKHHGVDEILRAEWTAKPILAICVGMQALFDHSDESGGVDCLGLLGGSVNYFNRFPSVSDAGLKVPHMGWNQVKQIAHPLWDGIDDESRFYFVHSYFVQAQDKNLVVGQTEYGERCDVAVATGNVFAAQFHPEKSGRDGLKLLSNFVNWSI
ncbi:imidazole glycerol phosphate synthase subunit HisH [Umboniibacter marinipuniceus]|uniref:Imidazole glycerol phosphate synthase subunit HisH n=1 Tax=Umboniibacter marinipuniceus TaxID=569599 RepID=A0A3M0ABV9_9GAMM|nr:imidazole glycerol phosphate synthase subunit HisH [Umboniibacter marinipuniceus]RMA80268.1 imidazole glycerol phosphate synthase subunit HisH [Umboniibacter marinipuniceus]